ncbi:MAG: RHS repeat-associated core domain-containing protein [Blastocatellia bacterium]
MTLDNSGSVLGRQAHLPFGEDFGESGTQEKHHFTSYERDAESALDYAINRFSQPSLGRFNQVDSVSGRASVPQSLNRYSYGLNEPIDVTDSNGQTAFPCYPPLTVPGVTALVDGFLPTEFCIVILVGVVATIDDPQPPPDCQEQDFKFAEGLGKYTAAELEALTEMALGESGFRFFDRKEIEALIATAVNRQTYNIAYFFDNSRPHFVDLSNPQGNPAPTQMLDILSLTGTLHLLRN